MDSATEGAGMEVPATRLFTRARIVALALIALAVLGLAFLRFHHGAGAVSVPKGAQAGQLELHSCHYGTEDGSYAADCGTLAVQKNRHDSQSRLIALPVKRIRARSAHPGAPIFRLQGGPGLSNMSFPDAGRFAGRHDVVLVGFRGVDGLDAARRALGYDRIDLLSESAGTRTALIYAWRYPKRIHRSVMIGVNPPGNFLWDAKTTGEQIRRYAALCAKDTSCRSRTPDLAASLHSAYQHSPGHFWF